MMRPRVAFAAAVLAAALAVPGAAQERRFTVSAGGGLERVLAYGSASGYAAGENDFPVTPAHSTALSSLGLAYGVTPRLALTLEGRFGFSTTVRLSDPNDGDEVDVATAKRWSLSLGVRYFLARGRLRPWLAAGAGLERLIAKEQLPLSRLGYTVAFGPPEDLSAVLLQAGTGIVAALTKAWGVWAEVRLARAFSRPDAVNSLLGAAGLSFSF